MFGCHFTLFRIVKAESLAYFTPVSYFFTCHSSITLFCESALFCSHKIRFHYKSSPAISYKTRKSNKNKTVPFVSLIVCVCCIKRLISFYLIKNKKRLTSFYNSNRNVGSLFRWTSYHLINLPIKAASLLCR